MGTWLICGGWDWILYYSPIAKYFKPYKLIDEYPSLTQMKHDAFWTTISSVAGSVIEMIICHNMAAGNWSFDKTLAASPYKSLFWILFHCHI